MFDSIHPNLFDRTRIEKPEMPGGEENLPPVYRELEILPGEDINVCFFADMVIFILESGGDS